MAPRARRLASALAPTLARRAYRAEATPADRAAALAVSAPLGFVAGAFGACVGVGGGAVIAPVVASARARRCRSASMSGTSLVAVVGTASGERVGRSRGRGLTDYQAAAALLGGGGDAERAARARE